MLRRHRRGPAPRHVFRWDLDKTYLRTEFDRARDLLKSALEKAHDKRAVPGAPALLRALKAAGGKDHRICIVSGSPTQMRAVLEAKLLLDGIEFDEFVLKNNLRNLLRGRFRALRSQIPYKLPALLSSRLGLSNMPPETLFGDDAESDALVYSLYSDILNGRVTAKDVEDVLVSVAAYPDERKRVMGLVEQIPHSDSVLRILIHLDRRTPTATYFHYGPRVVPIYNYFQAALMFYADGDMAARDVITVGYEMLQSGDFSLGALANSLQDLLWRGRLRPDIAARLALDIQELSDGWHARWPDSPTSDQVAWIFATRVRAIGEHTVARPPPPGRIDYVGLARKDHARRKK